MKKLLTLAAIFALVFTTCEQPTDGNNSGGNLPSLTIRNESSYVLTNVKFSGISFATSGSNDLLTSSQSVKSLTANDLNKAGYITFTRKDIGIACRTEAIAIGEEDYTFTFLDTSVVEEVANTGNKKSLAQITFVSKAAVEFGGLNVPKNDTVNVGEAFVGFPKQAEFTLRNTGVGKLLLTGTQPVKITGTGADAFSVVQPTSSEIAPNSSLTFKINFAPDAIQNYNATVTISSNDQDGDFVFTITAAGVPPKPIASVFYGESEIAQDGTVNAGEVLITLSKTITVTIKNTGVEVLTLDTANITITGAHAEAFTKTTNPGGSISAGGQTSFSIDCRPTEQGENNAVLVIPTNDNSRNPIVVYLKATGVKGSGILELKQDNTLIANNSLTPFDLGRTVLGSSKTLVFNIKNTGNIPLVLTGTPAVTSSNAAFTITTQPANTTINPEATVPFVIQYTPTAEQEDTGTITITNDSDAVLFVFNVKGTGYIQRPQITVRQGNTTINPNGEYSVGTVLQGKTSDTVFTIGNTGEANLTFVTVDGNRINLADNEPALFSVIQQPSGNTTVAPGGTTTFTVRFSPATVGSNFTATVQIKTNSQNDDEFSFTVKGSGRDYIIGDTGPAGGIIFYDNGSVINGWRYLEASLTDFNAEWTPGNASLGLGSSALSIGDGKQNTQLIVAKGYTSAAKICANLNINGFADWFLPSRDELNLMYQNLRKNGLGGFSATYYWSSSFSTRNNVTDVWRQHFDSGVQSTYNPMETYAVRAIRAF